MKSLSLQTILNATWLIVNIAAVVGIVTANKLVFTHFKFHFGTLLTVIHFLFTWVGLEAAKLVGLVEGKGKVEWWRVIPLSISFCGFVVLTNLSLQYNSVGFYQMAKVMTTPIMAALQFAFYKARFSRPILACLLLICAGVCLATATEMTLTALGFSVALAACTVTAVYSIWVETEQKRLGLNAMQLLAYQAPISAAMLIPLVPLLDNYREIIAYRPSILAVGAIVLSSFLALLVNVSTFMIIGRMSALTYNVAGHAKMCFIFASGYLFFDSKKGLSWLNLAGVSVAIAGVVAYSLVKMSENAMKQKQSTILSDDSVLLKTPIVESAPIPMESIRRSLLVHNDLARGKVVPVSVGIKSFNSEVTVAESESLISNNQPVSA